MLYYLPDLIVAWAAVAGICLAIVGARDWALYLILPAVVRWLLWPLAAPFVGTMLDAALGRWWWFIPLILVAPIVAVSFIMRLFVDVLGLLFGPGVAEDVGAVFVTRLIDWLTGRSRGRPIPHWEHEGHD